MLKTNKEIEKEFDENFKYFCQEHSCCFGNGEELKSFIHQTRIADLEEMERMIEEAVKEELAAKPQSRLEEVAEWYKIHGFNLLKSKIQKVKEEITK